MRRVTALLLAGALGWPALSDAQVLPPVPPGPPSPPRAVKADPPGVAKPAKSGGSIRQLQGPGELEGPMALPRPVPTAEKLHMPNTEPKAPIIPNVTGMPPAAGSSVPDVSGMPPADKDCCAPSCQMPPATCAPICPPPCCPPEHYEECHSCGASGLILQGELLYLRTSRTGASALVGAAAPFAGASALETDFDLGFRAGIGYLCGDGFFVLGTYTRLDNDPANLAITGIPTIGAIAVVIPDGNLSWDFDYQTVDLMAGAIVNPSPSIDLIFAGGVRLAEIEQVYQTTSVAAAASDVTALDLTGFGPRVGVEGRLYLSSCTALYGRCYGSLLRAEKLESSASLVAGVPANFTFERHEFTPVLEIALGTDFSLCNDHVLIGVGYQWEYWFDLGTSANTGLASDISLDGPFARILVLW